MTNKNIFRAGTATADISPIDSQFLAGYPHVERWSTGVHDPLTSSALAFDDGETSLLFVANDILYIPKPQVIQARQRIADATGLRTDHIMLTATHTHSGPVVTNRGPGTYSDVVPPADTKYLQRLEDGMVEAGIAAYRALRPAEAGLAIAPVSGIGTNRRDPEDVADPEIPVMAVRDADTKEMIAIMEVYSMHPTVMHEDSTLASGDFPAMARLYLQKKLGDDIPVLHHIGTAGNQSPRYCVKGQTFEEAIRLGEIMGKAIESALDKIEYGSDFKLGAMTAPIDFERRVLPAVDEAQAKLDAVNAKYERQKSDGTPRAVVRTTECDIFGAEATLALAMANESGKIDQHLENILPAEIQLLAVGPWRYIAWQGEAFVENGLAIKKANPNTFICCCANGTMAGYITTEEAVAEGGYEASTTLLAPSAPAHLIAETQKLIDAFETSRA